MASNTRIIELFGLPGCGKTTQKEMLLGYNSGYRFCIMSDISQQYKKISILKKIKYFPYKTLGYIFLLQPFMGYKKGDLGFWKSILIVSIVYSYGKSLYENCSIVVDHGVFQYITSLSYRRDFNISYFSCKLLARLMKSQNIDFLFNCEIEPSIAVRRIRDRNRSGLGRFDAIADNDKLLSLLIKEKNMIDNLYRVMSDLHVKGIHKLSMSSSPNQIFNDLCKLIIK